jgi:hypothetical protein
VKTAIPVYLVILWLALGSFMPLWADVGTPLSAPTKVSTSITIDGTINPGTETAWAPGLPVGKIPNDCAQFITPGTAPDVTLFALNDGTRVFLAFDIPDTSANANDALFLAFDPNHNHGANPEGGGTPDRALFLTFDNTAANNSVPTATNFTGTGTGWNAGAAGVPAGWNVKYSRITTGSGKWQVEMSFPATSIFGFAYLYLNKTGVATDCDMDGSDDDFHATYPPNLIGIQAITLPTQFPAPVNWTNMNFGPPPPTVRFNAPLCCSSADIGTSPSTQPFTAGVPVNINATVHNLHASSPANHVNVEIRVHDFGTGGAVISPFPISTQIPVINPSGAATTPVVVWPSPPAGLHGCIRAEIKPPTTDQYFIAAGQSIAQKNTDVACVGKSERREMQFNAFNPDQQQPMKILLATQVLLPPGFEGLKFDVQQPDRPLRPQEAFPVRLAITAAADTPLTEVPTREVKVPATAGGTATPPLHERTGTDAIVLNVNPGDRLHFSAAGQVDLDGNGPIAAAGPDGQDISGAGRRTFLLGGDAASRLGGALIGSFNNFANSFVIGTEGTVDVPGDVKELRLAVNDFDSGYGDNSGEGFAVTVSTLPPLNPAPVEGGVARAPAVTLPQINIAATSSTQVTIGQRTYHLLLNHGGVTYQVLVTNARDHGLVGGGYDKKYYLWIILLLLLLIILIWLIRRILRKKRPA